ncbi:MAG: S-layer homology domain-containing protein [Clostridia bacterium]|nr:S-layer homology domain-containing protein [Clostridia bacterium]
MNKIFKGIIATAAAISISSTAFAATFSDVEGTAYNWANAYVEDMAAKGLISGYPDGTFRPQNTVSKMEALSLFARAMGSRSQIHEATVNTAMDKYADYMETLDLKFGKEDIAFLLYRGALTEAEMTAYLDGDSKNQPMLRHEAATVIIKAMGLDAEAKRNLIFDLSYTDATKIPAAAKKYVYLITEKGIMAGGGDGTFSPETDVQRSQVAVMLSKMVDVMGISFKEVTITDIQDTVITAKDAADDSETYEISEDTSFFVDGKKVKVSKLAAGMKAVITTTEYGTLYVDVASSVVDIEESVILKSSTTANGKTTIKVTSTDRQNEVSYELSEDVIITKDGEEITVNELVSDDYLFIKTEGGKIASISVLAKEATIRGGTVEDIITEDGKTSIMISHDEEDYDGLILELMNNVTITKDGAEVDMNKVYRGDKVTVSLEYGYVKSIIASGNKVTVNGTLRAINISANPTITVLVDNKEATYDITTDIKLFVNGENATIYDFRVGDAVTLTTESNAVTKIESISNQVTEGQLSGTVTSVSATYKFVEIIVKDESGSTYKEKVYCNDNKTRFVSAAGDDKLFRDLKEGTIINAYGEYKNGVYEAKTIIIVK